MNDLKSGSHIELNGEPYEVLSKEFIKSAQRRPVMSCRLRNLISGRVLKYTFQQSDAIAKADLEKMTAQYLYKDKNNYYFMDNETFEQFSLPAQTIDDKRKYFLEGTQITILKFKGKPIDILLPIKMTFKVTSAPEAIRGNTVSGSVTKEVVIETGAKIKTPLFIKEGEKIIVDTRDGSYVGKTTK